MANTSTRELMIATVENRLIYQQGDDARSMAERIVDDLLGSEGLLAIVNRATTNGIDAGFEKGLRDSIAAVGEVPRCDYVTNDLGEPQLVMYAHAQRAIAKLSKRGLEELWKKETKDTTTGG